MHPVQIIFPHSQRMTSSASSCSSRQRSHSNGVKLIAHLRLERLHRGAALGAELCVGGEQVIAARFAVPPDHLRAVAVAEVADYGERLASGTNHIMLLSLAYCQAPLLSNRNLRLP